MGSDLRASRCYLGAWCITWKWKSSPSPIPVSPHAGTVLYGTAYLRSACFDCFNYICNQVCMVEIVYDVTTAIVYEGSLKLHQEKGRREKHQD